MLHLDQIITELDGSVSSGLGKRWLWRTSRFLIGVIPPIGCLVMLIHCCCLLGGYIFLPTEWIFDCSLLGSLAWFVTSFAFGFCWVHRAFLTYGVAISFCIDFQRCIGFGDFLYPLRYTMVAIGFLLFVFFIRRKAWREFYNRNINS